MTGWRVQWLADAGALQTHAAALDALARDAIEPNIFHESWLLLPALHAFAEGDALHIALIWRDDGALAALFPFQLSARARATPARLRLWQHPYCFLGTPLVAHDDAETAIAALLDAVERGDAPARCLDLPEITADGPFSQALASALRRRGHWTQQRDRRERAMFTLPADGRVESGLSAKQLRELRRTWKRLAAQGDLSVRELSVDEDPDDWVQSFLQLEASGWKGRAGTALANQTRDAEFFRGIARAAHARGRLHLLMLAFDGKPIAMQCNFFAADGGFAFKMAFDEQYASASPGVQLELITMERLASRSGLKWIDSCASPNHPMINRLWRDRRAIADHRLACGHGHARAWVGYLKLRRWLGVKLRRSS